MKKKSKMHGGYIPSSHIIRLIEHLSVHQHQTPDIKIGLNSSHFPGAGHGSIFLGTAAGYEGGDTNIRMLIGAHFAGGETIGIFGGKCNRGEIMIDTVIRETIEEIFNFTPTAEIITAIRDFLNENTQLYFILKVFEHHNAYSYIFDVSILGDFIRIISTIGRSNNIAYFIPTNTSLTNIEEYYVPNIQFGDLSSFNGANPSPGTGTGSTIDLSRFLRERFIRKQPHRTERRHGLDEIKYLSFASLSKLISSARTTGRYNIFIFGISERKNLEIQRFFRNALLNQIILSLPI
jgi:hypothetical protein